MSERPLVVGLGRVELQFISRVQRFPEGDRPTEVDSLSVQVGGSGAVAVGTAASLGCQARFACRLAEEFISKFILDVLRNAGVETRGVLAADRSLSGLRLTALDARRHRFELYSRGDVGAFDAADLDLNRLLDGARAVLIDGQYPVTQVKLAELARERSIPVIFDGSGFGNEVGELVALADVLLASERLASELARTDDLERSLLELQKLGPGAVVITLGDAGSIGLHGEQLVRQPAFPVDAVDVQGAGAVYQGAFCAALLSDLPFARCMEFASAAAALSCSEVGPWAGIPTRAQVLERIQTR